MFSAVGADDGTLERFYSENDGKSLRRLPSWVVPQVLFATISNVELAKSGEHTPSRIFDLVRNRIDVNVFAYSPRCTLELDSPEIEKRVKAAADALWDSGADVLVHIDPRLMRDAFFAKWPQDCLHVRRFDVAKPDGDGVARFSADIDKMGDHTLYGTKRKFSWTKPGSLVSVRAVKDGDPATARTLAAEGVVCSTNLVSGFVCGLASNEVLVAEADFPLDEVDPCSPHLVPFAREMALRYKKLGVKGHYVDEWGFQRPSAAMREHRAFWHSKHFAERYAKASGGRDLAKDMLPFVLGIDTPEYHAAANAYIRAIYDVCKETEEAFYASVKELFGPDVYVGKHASWWSDLGCWKEFFHDGLDWWVAKRDWAVSDENVPVCADTGMMKKFGSPLWLNECYGTNPRHYVRTLWRFALCGGRMSWHGITGDKKTDYLQRNYDKYSERRYHRIADMFSEDAVRAEQILRLLPLATRSPIDCPVAYIFGHERLVNWLDSGFEDWGRELVDGLAVRGYYADAYPASEIAGGTFSVKDDGLWVGKQRYSAVVLYNLSEVEKEAWENMVGSRVPRDRFGHAGHVPLPTFAGHAGRVPLPTFENPDVAEVAAYLDSIKAVKQTPFPAPRNGKIPLMRLPPSDGVIHLIDGTVVRVKGGNPDFAGDRIEGELESGGVRAKYSARGMFAFRAENGEVTALAGGEVTRIEAPGISLSLDTPADIALVKLADGWHGTWQTSADLAPIPPALKKLATKWVRLRGSVSSRPYEFR